ncbi:MAG: GyrI-like domain-containing protein [Methylovirgula sp.]
MALSTTTLRTGGVSYLAGIEIHEPCPVPSAWNSIQLAAHRYAAFSYLCHCSAIGQMLAQIRREWLDVNRNKIANAPYFEFYDSEFDKCTGHGGIEVWIPLKLQT